MTKTSLKTWCIDNNREEMLTEYINGNNDLSPDEISYGSIKQVNWKCKFGHEWISSPNNRTHQTCGCPICGNKKLVVGVNDLQTLHPTLASEWDYNKNAPLLPSEIISGSNKSVHWKCQLGHEYEQKISVRIHQKTGCPVCAGLKVQPEYNDLATTHPHLVLEWDIENNHGLTPQDVIAGSHKKVAWRCAQNHTWIAEISSRAYGHSGCPICANQKVLPGYNDLETVHPNLSQEWDYEHNGKIQPKDVIAGSNKSYYWICDRGHSYKAPVSSRLRGRGCPYCAGIKVLIGFNDLTTIKPQIASEWHSTLNGTLQPTDVSYGSNKKVWWQCKRHTEHIWQATISSRTTNGNGCPHCAKFAQTSYPEQRVAYFIQQYFPDIIQSYHPDFLKGLELDIYIPSLKIAIEYDGQHYHQNKKKDIQKILMCKQNGIELIRIREFGCPNISKYCKSFTYDFNFKDTTELDNIIFELFNYLGIANPSLNFKEFTRDDWEKIRMKYSNLNK